MTFATPSYIHRPREWDNWPLKMLVLSLVIVFAVLVGGLLALLRRRREPMGSPDVLERAKQRNREWEEEERREDAR